ncbi:MAG: LysE family translocator [Actinomycetota bacterium]|nr:LysE family translocator [Actinomycetota bacterium]
MDVEHLPTFVVASVLLMFVPGVDMALVTRQVVVHGRRAAFATLAGLLAGGLTHAAFATIGLSAVLLTSATAYTVVKTLGALYLVGLGLRTIQSGWKNRRDRAAQVPATRDVHGMSLRHAFLLGFLSDATNPKVAIFFLTFLPQFVVARGDAAVEIAFLGVAFNAIATTWWIGYVLLVDRVAGWFRRPTVRTAVETVTGAILVGVGVRLALERRG